MGTFTHHNRSGWLEQERSHSFFFFGAGGREGGRGCTVRKDDTTEATHVTLVNNKNIKHAANPKEGGKLGIRGFTNKESKSKRTTGI
jgi:hypothetical protein